MKRIVQDLLKEKGSEVFSIHENQTLRDATKIFNEKHIGALIVLNDTKEITGLISERDIIRKLATTNNEISEMKVNEVMTPQNKLIAGHLSDDIQYLMNVMTKNRIRHVLIICDDGECKTEGIISIGDVVKALVTDLDYENKMLKDYIEGAYPR